MSVFPFLVRAVSRPVAFSLPLRRAMATAPAGAAGDLLRATLGTDARPPSSPTGTAPSTPGSSDSLATASAGSSSGSSSAAESSGSAADLDPNLFGPRDFYGAADAFSGSNTLGELAGGGSRMSEADRYSSATVPYMPSAIPQTADPLCEFWVSLTMSHGNKLKATILLSKILDAIARQTDSPPLPIFRAAIIAASPLCRLKSIRKGAKTMIVPIPLNERQRTRFGVRWLLKAADKRAAYNAEKRIAMEMLAVLDGSSNVLKMIDERHKVAMMNRSNLPKDIGP